jgi:DNA-binding GntR family transcriptional regulator
MANELHVPSLVDAVYEAVRKWILTGEMQGGHPVTEMDLAQRFSVARPTAKAAVERLVHEGLLRRATNKTARVPLLVTDDIRDLYATRAFIERGVVATLATKRLVPDSARKSLVALRRATSDPLPAVVGLDIAFHRALVEALESPRLTRLYVSLMGEAHLCMAQVQSHRLLRISRIAEEHAAILSAIEGGDANRAAEEIDSHLERACNRLVGFLETAETSDPPAGRNALHSLLIT